MKCPILMILTALLCMVSGCTSRQTRYVEVKVADEAFVSRFWAELRPVALLRWSQPVEELSFLIASPHEKSSSAEIVLPSGQKIVPEVQFITSDGRTLIPDAHGFWGDEMYFTFAEGQPPSTEIKAIRLRSDADLKITRIVWRGYDPKVVKR